MLDIILFYSYNCFKTLCIFCTIQFLSKNIFSITYAATHMIQVKDLHSLSSITSELNYVESIFHLFIKMPHFTHGSMKNKTFSLEIKYLWKVCLHSDWYIMGKKIKKAGDSYNYIFCSPMVAHSLWNVNRCYRAKTAENMRNG